MVVPVKMQIRPPRGCVEKMRKLFCFSAVVFFGLPHVQHNDTLVLGKGIAQQVDVEDSGLSQDDLQKTVVDADTKTKPVINEDETFEAAVATSPKLLVPSTILVQDRVYVREKTTTNGINKGEKIETPTSSGSDNRAIRLPPLAAPASADGATNFLEVEHKKLAEKTRTQETAKFENRHGRQHLQTERAAAARQHRRKMRSKLQKKKLASKKARLLRQKVLRQAKRNRVKKLLLLKKKQTHANKKTSLSRNQMSKQKHLQKRRMGEMRLDLEQVEDDEDDDDAGDDVDTVDKDVETDADDEKLSQDELEQADGDDVDGEAEDVDDEDTAVDDDVAAIDDDDENDASTTTPLDEDLENEDLDLANDDAVEEKTSEAGTTSANADETLGGGVEPPPEKKDGALLNKAGAEKIPDLQTGRSSSSSGAAGSAGTTGDAPPAAPARAESDNKSSKDGDAGVLDESSFPDHGASAAEEFSAASKSTDQSASVNSQKNPGTSTTTSSSATGTSGTDANNSGCKCCFCILIIVVVVSLVGLILGGSYFYYKSNFLEKRLSFASQSFQGGGFGESDGKNVVTGAGDQNQPGGGNTAGATSGTAADSTPLLQPLPAGMVEDAEKMKSFSDWAEEKVKKVRRFSAGYLFGASTGSGGHINSSKGSRGHKDKKSETSGGAGAPLSEENAEAGRGANAQKDDAADTTGPIERKSKKSGNRMNSSSAGAAPGQQGSAPGSADFDFTGGHQKLEAPDLGGFDPQESASGGDENFLAPPQTEEIARSKKKKIAPAAPPADKSAPPFVLGHIGLPTAEEATTSGKIRPPSESTTRKSKTMTEAVFGKQAAEERERALNTRTTAQPSKKLMAEDAILVKEVTQKLASQVPADLDDQHFSIPPPRPSANKLGKKTVSALDPAPFGGLEDDDIEILPESAGPATPASVASEIEELVSDHHKRTSNKLEEVQSLEIQLVSAKKELGILLSSPVTSPPSRKSTAGEQKLSIASVATFAEETPVFEDDFKSEGVLKAGSTGYSGKADAEQIATFAEETPEHEGVVENYKPKKNKTTRKSSKIGDNKEELLMGSMKTMVEQVQSEIQGSASGKLSKKKSQVLQKQGSLRPSADHDSPIHERIAALQSGTSSQRPSQQGSSRPSADHGSPIHLRIAALKMSPRQSAKVSPGREMTTGGATGNKSTSQRETSASPRSPTTSTAAKRKSTAQQEQQPRTTSPGGGSTSRPMSFAKNQQEQATSPKAAARQSGRLTATTSPKMTTSSGIVQKKEGGVPASPRGMSFGAGASPRSGGEEHKRQLSMYYNFLPTTTDADKLALARFSSRTSRKPGSSEQKQGTPQNAGDVVRDTEGDRLTFQPDGTSKMSQRGTTRAGQELLQQPGAATSSGAGDRKHPSKSLHNTDSIQDRIDSLKRANSKERGKDEMSSSVRKFGSALPGLARANDEGEQVATVDDIEEGAEEDEDLLDTPAEGRPGDSSATTSWSDTSDA
ncbi:unnamed protein product [Amoebophrya sp. A120]|nr:unnamed protein product [Amoebophrya sp. A120]|eukprot:GSA120T00007793001.1